MGISQHDNSIHSPANALVYCWAMETRPHSPSHVSHSSLSQHYGVIIGVGDEQCILHTIEPNGSALSVVVCGSGGRSGDIIVALMKQSKLAEVWMIREHHHFNICAFDCMPLSMMMPMVLPTPVPAPPPFTPTRARLYPVPTTIHLSVHRAIYCSVILCHCIPFTLTIDPRPRHHCTTGMHPQ